MQPKVDPSQNLTAEFGHEVEAERQQLLRRRFLWYTGTVSVFSVLGFIIALAFESVPTGTRIFYLLGLLLSGLTCSLFVGSFFYVYFTRSTRWPMIKICLMLIVVTGMLSLLGGPLAIGQVEKLVHLSNASSASKHPRGSRARSIAKKPEVSTAESNKPSQSGDSSTPVTAPPSDAPVDPAGAVNPGETAIDTDAGDNSTGLPEADVPESFRESLRKNEVLTTFAAIVAGVGGALSIFGRHFLACLFLPLTPRECIRPLVPLLIFNAGLIVIYVARALVAGASGNIVLAGLGVMVLSPIIGVPGWLVITWRDSNFREVVSNRKMRGRYVEMKQELSDARRIHESLFPQPIRDGDISLCYKYEPMSQIGGDYVFCKHTLGPAGNQRLNVVMLDVTGHGIPAALTVNRLHGELERIFAEQPNSDPGQVLRLLNRYVNLTLAGHWVYVTGLCIRADAVAQTLEYASGGHPPAFLYAANGTMDELHSTAIILGAVPDAEFDALMDSRRFMPGDRLIAYTDGAFECRNEHGHQLRISGIRTLIAKGPAATGEWPAAIIKSIEQFRYGKPQDDTLVVELCHSLTAPVREVKPESSRARTGIFGAIKTPG